MKIIKESDLRIKATFKKKLNNLISDIMAPNYFREFPIDEIDGVLRKNGLMLVQEDGTPWEGFFTGREGRANIELATTDTNEIIENCTLALTWYKMGSGKYEIVAYLS